MLSRTNSFRIKYGEIAKFFGRKYNDLIDQKRQAIMA